jgi:hypothetical protein
LRLQRPKVGLLNKVRIGPEIAGDGRFKSINNECIRILSLVESASASATDWDGTMNVIHRTVTAEVGGHPCSPRRYSGVGGYLEMGMETWSCPLVLSLSLPGLGILADLHLDLGLSRTSFHGHTERFPSLKTRQGCACVPLINDPCLFFHFLSERENVPFGTVEPFLANETFEFPKHHGEKITNNFNIQCHASLFLSDAPSQVDTFIFFFSFSFFFLSKICIAERYRGYRKSRLVLGLRRTWLTAVLGCLFCACAWCLFC